MMPRLISPVAGLARMFTKRHYDVVAEVLQAARPRNGAPAEREQQWLADCRAMANVFAEDNPAFDHSMFWYVLWGKAEP